MRDHAKTDRIERLLAAMTLDEKIGQLNMLTADLAVTGPGMPADYMKELKAGRLGSMLNLFGLDLMREVQLASIYRIEPGPDLCRLFRLPIPRTTYGRTAFIYLDGYLAIELLEIVAPVVADAASVR